MILYALENTLLFSLGEGAFQAFQYIDFSIKEIQAK